MRKSNKKKNQLKCHFCSNKATHAVMLELRDKPGPPVKENNVIHVVCDIHAVDTSFDNWVPVWAFSNLCKEWKEKANIILNKRFCSINMVKFK